MFLCGFGCSSSKPTPDPLAGWKMDFAPQLDPVISKDCQDYIQKLSPDEKKSPNISGYFEDGTGQHAVEITIGINGRWWRHILIYDKDNKRIKTIKYATGYYAS
jgi:hypothetical protein